MSKNFNNHTELNNGFFLNGMTPLDDRLIWSSLEDLYIDSSKKEECGLYAVAYDGMQIEIVNGTDVPRIFVLKDSFPYSPDNRDGDGAINVNAANFRDYWYEISALEIKSTDSTIKPNVYETQNGKVVDLGVNIDKDTIRSIGGELTTFKYKITQLSKPNNNMLASYRLQHLVPGATSFVDVPGCSDINVPKDYILKEVHVCKAKMQGGKLVETAVQGQCTEAEWLAADGDVYLHFIWDTTDAISDPSTSESWLKVSDVIDIDLDSLEKAVDDLRKDVDDIFDGEVNFVHKNLETSAAMLTDHGSLGKNTTVAQLEKMTLSEILEKILFEIATPKRVQSSSVSCSFASVYNTTVAVGAELPGASNLSYSYKPETWKWESKDKTVSETQVLLDDKSATYMFNESNSTSDGIDMSTSEYTLHKLSNKVIEGTNGYYYVVVEQTKLKNATNSVGEVVHTPSASDLKSAAIAFTGAWNVVSNASKEFTSASAAWSARNTNPGSFAGNNTRTEADSFALSNTTIYLQWPQVASSENLYVYVPQSRSITSAKGANPTISNAFDVNLTVTSDGTVSITNSNGVSNTFKKYRITGSAGITTAAIKIS